MADAPGPPGLTNSEPIRSLRGPAAGSRISCSLTVGPVVGVAQFSGTAMVAHWNGAPQVFQDSAGTARVVGDGAAPGDVAAEGEEVAGGSDGDGDAAAGELDEDGVPLADGAFVLHEAAIRASRMSADASRPAEVMCIPAANVTPRTERGPGLLSRPPAIRPRLRSPREPHCGVRVGSGARNRRGRVSQAVICQLSMASSGGIHGGRGISSRSERAMT